MARALAAEASPVNEAALVRTSAPASSRESVDLAADLLCYAADDSHDRTGVAALVEMARVHAPLFTLQGGTNARCCAAWWPRDGVALTDECSLSGGVFATGTDDLSDLRHLVDDIGRRSSQSRIRAPGIAGSVRRDGVGPPSRKPD